MTNTRQLKSVYRPLMDKYPEFGMIGNRFMCKIPIFHLISGLFIERCSEPDCALPRWTVTPLYMYRLWAAIEVGTYYEALSRSEASAEKSWLWSDPTMVPELIDAIETVALPKLDIYGTPEGYATLPRREYGRRDEPLEDRMIVQIAAGNLDAARAIWHEREPLYRGKIYHPESRLYCWQHQIATVAEPLLDSDRPALAGILHSWEAANVRRAGIERYWESTPFPLEL